MDEADARPRRQAEGGPPAGSTRNTEIEGGEEVEREGGPAGETRAQPPGLDGRQAWTVYAAAP